jgi:hypothetical protein
MGPNQKLWIETLRTGNYKQGKTFLNSDNHFCCLGVACELFFTGKRENSTSGIAYIEPQDRSGGCVCDAPPSIIESLGLYGRYGQTRSGGIDSLANLNDMGKTFNEIADIIEADPSVYFTKEV